MKNLKLLLATTAILSAGLMIDANAVDVNVTSFNLKTRVAFVEAIEFELQKELDFGIIRDPESTDKVIINAEDGSTEGSTTKLIAGTTSRGEVFVKSGSFSHYSYTRRGSEELSDAYALRLQFPSEIRLSSGTNTVCGYVTGLRTDDFTSNSAMHIGGTFEAKAKTGESLALGGNCTGEGTVTLVWGIAQ